MKKILSLFFVMSLSFSVKSQETIKIKVSGISPTVASQLKANQDRVSWYFGPNGTSVATNLTVNLNNQNQKSGDRGRLGIKADPGTDGSYNLNAEVEVKLKRVDKSMPIEYEIVLETVLGNEIFSKGTSSLSDLEKPIILDNYMWRASNDKIGPEKKLCLAFSAYIEDPVQRENFSKIEGPLKFERSSFELFLKQEEAQEWKKFNEPLQGTITNGNAFNMTSPLPGWINTSKPIFVRFSAKTPNGNYVWGEYSVQPNEYRKEFRSKYFTKIAFDKTAKVETEKQENTPVNNNTEPAIKNEAPKNTQIIATPNSAQPKTPIKNVQTDYKTLLSEADNLFLEGKYSDSKEKYIKASEMNPRDPYPKQKITECESKLSGNRPIPAPSKKD